MFRLCSVGALVLCVLQCVHLKKFVVNTDFCTIEDADPFGSAEVREDFQRVQYKSCSKLQPLTSVAYNAASEHYELAINRTAYRRYVELDLHLRVEAGSGLRCCYMAVERLNEQSVHLGEQCTEFQSGDQLPATNIGFVVQCYAHGRLIYTNAHATVPERSDIRRRLEQWADQRGSGQRALSVLIIGIDTVSRQQLIRAMPETRRHLDATGWFELAGYNKMADNTLPNVLALTTGYNRTSVNTKCDPLEELGLDRCKFLWKLYQELGYVTAFGEDDTPINTFNYRIPGFHQVPVDYYLRPYLQAAEQWLDTSQQLEQQGQTCLGYEYAAEHVYEYALEFARRYRNASHFGFFWTNTHSHGQSISRTSAMDAYMRQFLQRLASQGSLDHSVVLLLSDHGMREGRTRQTPLGWLEERLPFLYMWLPATLRAAHPEFVRALRGNRRQLSSPFDVYATLKHILRLSSPQQRHDLLGDAVDCPRCQSLLHPLPANRSCSDAGIPEHWCACYTYVSYRQYTALDQRLAQLALAHINELFERHRGGQFAGLCEPLTLEGIVRGYRARLHLGENPRVSIRRLQLRVLPTHTIYEFTFRLQPNDDIHITGFSRFDVSSEFCFGALYEQNICKCR